MNEEQPTTEQSNAPLVETQQTETKSLESQPADPSRRLRELLAIPERERSDALWDEIIGLEIQLAPGNRASSPHPDMGRPQDPGRRQDSNRRPEQARRQDPTSGAKSTKRFFKKPRRGPGTPPGKR